MSAHPSNRHRICSMQGCLGSMQIRWELSSGKSRHHTQPLAMTVRAAIRAGDHHADVARLQCGSHAHTHSTQSTPLAPGDPKQPTRGPALSSSIQKTPERSATLKSQLSRLAWPKNTTSAEQERRWRPRWGKRAEPHRVRAMIHEGEGEQQGSCSLSWNLAERIESRQPTN